MIVDSLGITLLLGIFGVLVVLRVPITFCLAISAIITGLYLNVPLEAIVKVMADGVMNFSLLAIPFFIVMGEIMNEAVSPRDLSTWPISLWEDFRAVSPWSM